MEVRVFLPRLNGHDVKMFRSACSPSLQRWDSKKTPPTNSGKKQSKPLGLQKDSPDQVRSETVLISVPPKRLPVFLTCSGQIRLKIIRNRIRPESKPLTHMYNIYISAKKLLHIFGIQNFVLMVMCSSCFSKYYTIKI